MTGSIQNMTLPPRSTRVMLVGSDSVHDAEISCNHLRLIAYTRKSKQAIVQTAIPFHTPYLTRKAQETSLCRLKGPDNGNMDEISKLPINQKGATSFCLHRNLLPQWQTPTRQDSYIEVLAAKGFGSTKNLATSLLPLLALNYKYSKMEIAQCFPMGTLLAKVHHDEPLQTKIAFHHS